MSPRCCGNCAHWLPGYRCALQGRDSDHALLPMYGDCGTQCKQHVEAQHDRPTR